MDGLIEDLLEPASQVALIIGIAEVIKTMGVEPRYIPLIDLALGLISGIFVYSSKYGLMQSLIIGAALGLSACGAFSGFKNVVKGG